MTHRREFPRVAGDGDTQWSRSHHRDTSFILQQPRSRASSTGTVSSTSQGSALPAPLHPLLTPRQSPGSEALGGQ